MIKSRSAVITENTVLSIIISFTFKRIIKEKMAKPIPLPLGRADPHILESNGAETNIMNFYVTSYSTSFVKPNTTHNKSKYSDIPAYTGTQTFVPRSAPENKGTGFVSNVRPQIFYKESMDKIDNPELR